MELNPIILSKLILWIIAVTASTILLRKNKMTSKMRTIYLAVGTLVFGFGYGLLVKGGLNPNPMNALVSIVKTLITSPSTKIPLRLSIFMPVVMLGLVLISNKSICGWGCQLGLLQDLLYRAPVPKIDVKFKISNTVRILFFFTFVATLAITGLDLIGLINPFKLFRLSLTPLIIISAFSIMLASLFMYRPWCRFLCPFGLTGWIVEQFSIQRPTIDREKCKECTLCVKACPTQAMADFYDGKIIHADCFACGNCIRTCPSGALKWE